MLYEGTTVSAAVIISMRETLKIVPLFFKKNFFLKFCFGNFVFSYPMTFDMVTDIIE